MKQFLKQMLIGLSSLALILTMAVGCGNNEDEGDEGKDQESMENAEEGASEAAEDAAEE